MGSSRRPGLALALACAVVLGSGLGAGAQGTVPYWLGLGNQYAAGGQYRQALEAYQQAEALDPRSAEAAYGTGWAYYQLGSLPAAEAALRRALHLNPGHRDAALTLAQVYLSRGEGQAAEPLLRPLYAADSQDYAATLGLAQALTYQQRWGEARPLLEQAIHLRPDQAHPRVLLGRLYLRQGQYAPAEAALLEAVTLEPSFEPAQRELVDLYLRTDRARQAQPLIRALVLRYPGDRALLEANVRAARAVQRPAELQEALERLLAVATPPQAPALRRELAESYLAAGLPQLAEQHLRVLLSGHPQDTAVLALLAQTLLRQQRLAEAGVLLAQLTRLAPTQAAAPLELARVLLATGQSAEALSAAQQALRLAPDSADALTLARQAATDLGDDALVLSYTRRLTARHPAEARGRAELARQLTTVGHLGEALAVWQGLLGAPGEYGQQARVALLALAAGAGNPEYERVAARRLAQADPTQEGQLAALLLAQGRRQEAGGVLAPALLARPEDPDLLATQARLLRLSGDPARAITAADFALGRAPRHPRANLEKGLALLASGQAEAAFPCLRRALLADPLAEEGYPALVQCAAALLDPQPAVDLLLTLATDAASPAPERASALAWGALARVWEQRQGAEAAAHELEALAQVAPWRAQPALAAAEQYSRAGLPGSAGRLYRQAAHQPAAAPRALRLAAVSYFLAGEPAALLEAAGDYLLSVAHDAEAVALVSALRAQAADVPAPVLAAVVSLVGAAPDGLEYQRRRVDLFAQQGRLVTLESEYAARPDTLLVQLGLVQIAQRRGQGERALELLEAAPSPWRQDPAVAAWRAALLREAGRPEQAAAGLETVVAPQARVALERAEALAALGRPEPALAELVRALAAGADPEAVRGLLDGLAGDSHVETRTLLAALDQIFARAAHPAWVRQWVSERLPAENPLVQPWLQAHPESPVVSSTGVSPVSSRM